MITKIDRSAERARRHARVRTKVSGTTECPRLAIAKSNKNIIAQIIDDTKGVTLVACSTMEKELVNELQGKTKQEQAKIVGAKLAEKALAKGISAVVFDRGGYLYTGRVASLAEGAREAGLKF